MTRPRRQGQSAFSEAYQAHRQRLYQYFRRRISNGDDAQELAQETFLRLLRVDRADLVRDPQAYLYRIARNLVYERACKALPIERWADDSELEALADPSAPEADADRAALNEKVERIVAELPPRHQAIILLFCHEGLSQREIGERLSLSKSMVQKCLAQGLALCRKRLRAQLAPRSRKGVMR